MISTIRAACLACVLALAVVPAIVGFAQVPSAWAPVPFAAPQETTSKAIALKSLSPARTVDVKWEQKKEAKQS